MDTELTTHLVDAEQATDHGPQLLISRAIYSQDAYNTKYHAEHAHTRTIHVIMNKCRCSRNKIRKTALTYFPVVNFIRTYKIKDYILSDSLAGITTCFMHIPQAMGYGLLASLRPVHGLYSTFFPILVYLLFGTSPFISFGTNAVMALLTHDVVEREARIFKAERIALHNFTNETSTEEEIMDVKIETAMACCFISGAFLTLIGLLKLGIVTTYMSVSFVGGFTTAAAIHIACSQIPKLLGIRGTTSYGAGKNIYMFINLFSKINETNWAEVTTSVICIVILLTVKICINEKCGKKMKIPIPIDLILVIIATVLSHFLRFQDIFKMQTVGLIPTGFTVPTIPRFQNAGNIMGDALIMAVVSFAMSISMAKLTAHKHAMQVNNNQELIAYGASNMISGFFHCFPSATSPPRTMILSSMGSKTTLNAVPTAAFFLLLILLIARVFASLPLSVLAAMIIISMKDLLLQYKDLPKIWRINKFDFLIWVITNAVGVLADLNYGILAGVVISLLSVTVQDQIADNTLLGVAKTEDLILNKTEKYQKDISNIKIFKVQTNLYFATAEKFKSQIFSMILNPKTEAKKLVHVMNKFKESKSPESEKDHNCIDMEMDILHNNSHSTKQNKDSVQFIIIDCSVIHYIDNEGIATMEQVIKDYKQRNIEIYLTGVPENSLRKMEAAGLFVLLPRTNVYLDVFDALTILQRNSKVINAPNDH